MKKVVVNISLNDEKTETIDPGTIELG